MSDTPSMRTGPVLTVHGVTRRFGPRVTANDDVTLQVAAGEVLGVLGHNGAGKTTLVSQIIGLLKPDVGAITVNGVDAVAKPGAARRQVSVQPQSHAPLDGLTPMLAIELVGRLRGLSRRDAAASAATLVDELDIGQWAGQRALPDGGGLSGGVRRLTSFAMALAAPVPLIILDEPTNDVDASRRRLLWQAVRRRADQGSALLVVTHNVTEAERVMDQLVVLHHGRVIARGTPAGLRGAGDDDLRLEVELPAATQGQYSAMVSADGVPEWVQLSPGAPRASRGVHAGRRLLLTIPRDQAPNAVTWAQRLRADDFITSYALGPTTLEDAYVALTADTYTEETTNV